MGWEQIGPFLVDSNANSAQKNDVRAVVNRMPPALRSPSSGYIVVNFGPRPDKAPSWALGFNQSANKFWVKPNQSSADRQYVIAHEFWHAWSRRHGVLESQSKQLIVGPRGNTETSSWTNDPDEGLAHAFALAIGTKNPFPKYDFRAYVPNTSYSHFMAILNGGSSYNPPPPSNGGGTGASNPTRGNPNLSIEQISWITQFLTWWNQPVNHPDHDRLANWNQILERYTIDTNNTQSATFIRTLLTQNNVPMDQALLGGADDVLLFLGDQIGTDEPGGVGFDLLNWNGLFDGISKFLEPISHAFFFLIIIIIGIAILFLGAKSRPSTSGASE